MSKYGGYKLNRDGDNVRDLLDKIDELRNATQDKDGTMSAGDKTKLDGLDSISLAELAEILV